MSVNRCSGDVPTNEERENRVGGDERGNKPTKDRDHRGVSEEWQHNHQCGGSNDDGYLHRVGDIDARHRAEGDDGTHNEEKALGLKAQLGHPVRETHHSRTANTKTGSRDRECCGACGRALQGRNS